MNDLHRFVFIPLTYVNKDIADEREIVVDLLDGSIYLNTRDGLKSFATSTLRELYNSGIISAALLYSNNVHLYKMYKNENTLSFDRFIRFKGDAKYYNIIKFDDETKSSLIYETTLDNPYVSIIHNTEYTDVGELTGEPNSGKLYYPSELDTSKLYLIQIFNSNKEKIYTIIGAIISNTPEVVEHNELCFIANNTNSTIKLNKIGNPTSIQLEISTNGTIWNNYTIGNTITLSNINDKVYIRNSSNSITNFSTSNNDYYQFEITGSISSSGNIMSLVDKSCNTTTIPNEYCFNKLFRDCELLLSPPILPATILKPRCYQNMFENCTSIKISDSSGTKFFSCPEDVPSNAVKYMFKSTGGTYATDPVPTGEYYYY